MDEATRLDVQLYMFENDPRPGEYVVDKVQGAIKGSQLFFVLISKRSQYSAYVHQEIGYAEGQGIPVIPLVEPGVNEKNLGMLGGREYISFDPENPESYLEKVESFIEGVKQGMQAVAEAVIVIVIILFVALIFAILIGMAKGTS